MMQYVIPCAWVMQGLWWVCLCCTQFPDKLLSPRLVLTYAVATGHKWEIMRVLCVDACLSECLALFEALPIM